MGSRSHFPTFSTVDGFDKVEVIRWNGRWSEAALSERSEFERGEAALCQDLAVIRWKLASYPGGLWLAVLWHRRATQGRMSLLT